MKNLNYPIAKHFQTVHPRELTVMVIEVIHKNMGGGGVDLGG